MAKVKVFLKVGQTLRSRSLGQKFWHPWKGLFIRNVHRNFESPNSSGKEAMAQVYVFNQSCQKDNIARRRQPYVNTVATISNPSDSKGQFFMKVGQPSRSRSLGQKFWYPGEGLVTRNVHVKYESPTSSG